MRNTAPIQAEAIDLNQAARTSARETLISMGISQRGLSSQEAEESIQRHGINVIDHKNERPWWKEYLHNFSDPLVLILVAVVLVSTLMGQLVDATLVTLMIISSVSLNFIQEHRANKAAQQLQKRLSATAQVWRDGQIVTIASDAVVVGDQVVLNAGDMIPADGRLLEVNHLFVNQASLTGEALPQQKRVSISSKSSSLTESVNIVFAGTHVVTGTGTFLVLAVGSETQYGKIAATLVQDRELNEFSKGIQRFSWLILRIIVIFVLFIFLFEVLYEGDFWQSLTFAIAVAVGLTPEFLPMIMSVNMGRASLLMARKGVIVKKLTAIPSFGSMDVLCTDKTGTLTQDKISVVEYVDITGVQSDQVLEMAYLNSHFQTGISNPLDDAVLSFGKKRSLQYIKVDEIPFDFERKLLSVIVKQKAKLLLVAKGAPESILKRSTTYFSDGKHKLMTKAIKKQASQTYARLSSNGFRVLAVAIKLDDGTALKTEQQLTMLGFVAFLDPAKKGVRHALDLLEAKGIEVKVITGDSEVAAVKICDEVGVIVKGVLTGVEYDHLPETRRSQKVLNTTIFARFDPDQKESVIKVLKQGGKVVGYMGDGINDAPSLKAADVGISVENAVDVAKDSADIILTHKSLLQLHDGVVEGRITFGNTMKYVMMGLSSNFGNMFSVLVAVVFLPFLPMLPLQILLNNFMYDISQLALPTDKVDDEYTETPKRWNMNLITRFMFIFGPISSIFDIVSFVFLFSLYALVPSMFQTGWFMVSLATQALVIHVIRTRRLPLIESNASLWVYIATIGIVIVGWCLPYTTLGGYFGFVPLPVEVVRVLVMIVGFYLITTEVGKRFYYRQVG